MYLAFKIGRIANLNATSLLSHIIPMKKIICTHLYNDFSGSPLVLATAIKGLIQKGHTITLLTSESEGFLSDLKVDKVNIPYEYRPNKLMRLLFLLLNQWQVFRQILKYRKEEVVIYVNTLLPFGAALAAKLTGKKVIYHIHETSIRPILFKYFLKLIAAFTANQAIYVSKYLMKTEAIPWTEGKVVYNALSDEFIKTATSYVHQNNQKAYPFTVLMLCSLKKYKGIDQFVALAKHLPNYRFELVLNATTTAINDYFNMKNLPENLILFPKQNNVHWFYKRAHLVVNLSNPQEWIETFGMTLLEAMTYGIPVIAPAIGGPVEVVQDGKNGYCINSQHLAAIIDKIKALANKNGLYQSFSANALDFANLFQKDHFVWQINRAFE